MAKNLRHITVKEGEELPIDQGDIVIGNYLDRDTKVMHICILQRTPMRCKNCGKDVEKDEPDKGFDPTR